MSDKDVYQLTEEQMRALTLGLRVEFDGRAAGYEWVPGIVVVPPREATRSVSDDRGTWCAMCREGHHRACVVMRYRSQHDHRRVPCECPDAIHERPVA